MTFSTYMALVRCERCGGTLGSMTADDLGPEGFAPDDPRPRFGVRSVDGAELDSVTAAEAARWFAGRHRCRLPLAVVPRA